MADQSVLNILPFVTRLLLSTAAFLVILYLLQDFMIFPSAKTGIFGRGTRTGPLPAGVTAHTVSTEDGKQLELWYYKPDHPNPRDTVAIIFHGNGGTVDGFFGYQQWLGNMGISSYSFDYRGYGFSTGWPTEKGLYLDSDAVWKFVSQAEQTDGSNILLFGISIGSGPASYLASKIDPQTLLLFSGYSSLPDVAREKAVYKYLTWLLRYELPVAEYVSTLSSTCLILAHGERDSIISYNNLARIEGRYQGTGQVLNVTSKQAGHNDLLNHVHRKLADAIVHCGTKAE